ncbi:MAG: FtsX-like permease family protein [Bacteroidota bacterium]
MRSQVRQQFLYEAVIISLAALLLSFAIFLGLSRMTGELLPQLTQVVKLELTPALAFYFVVFSIVVGVIAGFLPAVFFSRVNVIAALKESSSVKVFRHVNFRKVLVVAQYTFTLVFITATVIAYKQYKSFLAFDLGYNTENIVNVKLLDNKPEIAIKEFNEIPEVTGVSKSSLITSVGSFWSSQMKYENHGDSIVMAISLDVVDENYFAMHAHEFVAGTNFKSHPKTYRESTEAIVTEETLKTISYRRS